MTKRYNRCVDGTIVHHPTTGDWYCRTEIGEYRIHHDLEKGLKDLYHRTFDLDDEMIGEERYITSYDPDKESFKPLIEQDQKKIINNLKNSVTKEEPWTANTYSLLRISQLAESVRQTGLALSDDEDQYFTPEHLKEIGEGLANEGAKMSRLVIELLKSYHGWSEDRSRKLVVEIKDIG